MARFGAWVFDGIIVGVAAILLLCPSFAFLSLLIGHSAEGAVGLLRVFYGVLFGTAWLYYATLESSRRRATIGKQSCDLAVVDLEGRQISFGRATVRFLSKLLLSSLLTFGLGYLLALVTHRKQALHDLIAGTVVVERTDLRG